MNHQSLTPFGIRARFVVVAMILGVALGGFVGVRWVTRDDPPPVQQIFVHEYLLARVEQMFGFGSLGGMRQPFVPGGGWMQQFPMRSQMRYWRARFAGRITVIECVGLSGAVVFALLALRLTRRRFDDDLANARRIRRGIQRPWD
jgi:hypothetical protein